MSDSQSRCAAGDVVLSAITSARARCVWAVLLAVFTTASHAQAQSYRAYVASESEDEVAVLEFTPGSGLSVEKVIRVGRWPAEIEGPHGLFFDPSGEYWYLTLGHGFPNGYLLKYEAGPDTVVAAAELGFFPATVSLTPDGVLAFAVNSNFYGDPVPSTVSVVDTNEMFEIERVTTCTMPHGSRLSPDGTLHYSACMMDDQLVEMSTFSLEVTRRLHLGDGRAGRRSGHARPRDGRGRHERRLGHGRLFADLDQPLRRRAIRVRGVQPGQRDRPGGHRLVERGPAHSGAGGSVQPGPDPRRIPSARVSQGERPPGRVGPEDGRATGPNRERSEGNARCRSDFDDRYAFVTVEGIGGQPGIVEVIDLSTYERAAVAEVGKQAGGITLVPGAS